MLINNAGIYEDVADNAADDEWHTAWDRTLTINLQAAADLCRLAVSHFLDRGEGGRIVNVVSRAAYRGNSPQHWHYAASKAALVGVTKTIARGYAAEGVLAFGVAPGFTVTEMAEEYLAEPRRREDRRRHSARPRREHRRGRRDDPLAGGRCAGIRDGNGDRRQRRELCSLKLLPASVVRGEGDHRTQIRWWRGRRQTPPPLPSAAVPLPMLRIGRSVVELAA